MSATKFRTQFTFKSNPSVNWFPGHMNKVYKELPEQFKKIDILLEVRDARLPITSGNPELLKYMTPNIKRIILFNKFDLCNKELTQKIIKNNFKECETMIMSAKTKDNVQRILERISKEKKEFKTIGTWAMVCGIPNVGKSSIINALRERGNMHANNKSLAEAKKGHLPTTTRHIDFFRVSDNPNIYIMDSPGIIPPKLNRYNLDSFKLSSCRNIKSLVVEKNWVSDFILFQLNQNHQTKYVESLKLKEATDDIHLLLEQMTSTFKKTENECHDLIIKRFNDGDLGKVTMDEDSIRELAIIPQQSRSEH